MCGRKSNYFIIGYMGSGKTTVGKALADTLGKSFLDMDEVIQEKQGMSISRIFMKYGEHQFRNLEGELLDKITGNGIAGGDVYEPVTETVISCGGGIILDSQNRDILEDEFVIYLTCDPAEMYERVKDNPHLPNAYFHVKDEKERQRIFKEQYEQRKSLYNEISDIAVGTDGKDIQTIVSEITEKIKVTK